VAPWSSSEPPGLSRRIGGTPASHPHLRQSTGTSPAARFPPRLLFHASGAIMAAGPFASTFAFAVIIAQTAAELVAKIWTVLAKLVVVIFGFRR